MKTTYKYLVNRIIRLPLGSKVLSVAYQGEDLYVWVLQDKIVESTIMIDYNFYVIGTGWEISPEDRCDIFVGTVFQGPFVWHVFYGC